MEVKLVQASLEQKTILKNLLELYHYDFTEFEHEDVGENGLYGYKYLDYYWTEEDRYPYLIKVNDKWAGFALIRKTGVNSNDNNNYSIAEFFIMKKYRRLGIGEEVAFMIFDRFRGEWKVSEIENNVPAQFFWRKTITKYTRSNFEEIRESEWEGPIQKFTNINK